MYANIGRVTVYTVQYYNLDEKLKRCEVKLLICIYEAKLVIFNWKQIKMNLNQIE